jgi:single-strand DNA-binding protein
MSINEVVITGNLTRDPELAELGSGTKVCRLRVAVNSREKVDGTWSDRPNYFDVSVFGGQGEAAARHLAKGRQVAVSGQLRWREWQSEDGGRREAVSITAGQVQFLGSPREPGRSEDATTASAPAAGEPARGVGDEDELPF